MNKRYVIEVATNKASLEKLKSELSTAIQIPFDEAAQEGRIKGLTRSEKATIKNDLATLFGVADYQADALRKMVQGIIPSDTKGIESMKKQLQDTLGFATGIMQKMQQIGDATDWMKQGISFVDDFSKLQADLTDTQGVVKGLEKTVRDLTKSFDVFKDALAVTNSEAFLKRFGSATRSEAEDLAQATKELEKIAKTRNKALQMAVNQGQTESVDFTGFSREEIEEEYKASIEIIKDGNKEIERLRKKYKGKTSDLYKDAEYIDQIGTISSELNRIKNMPGLDMDDIGHGLKASLKEATDSVKTARNEIQNIIKDLKSKGIEVAITLPDASSTEFASQINDFVKQASNQFKKHPVEISVDLANPFKATGMDDNGVIAELTDKQKQLRDDAIKAYEDNAAKHGIEVNAQKDLAGMYSPDTNKISRNILTAFNNLYNVITAGQKNITAATEAWRDDMAEKLVVKPKFDASKAKQELENTMIELQDVLDKRELDIYTDTEALVSDIERALKEKQFVVDIKAKNIDGSDATLNIDNVNLGSANGYQMTGGLPVSQTTHKAPPKPSTPTVDKQTSVVAENSNAVSDGTRTQRVLTDAINNLNSSIQANAERNKVLTRSDSGLTGEQVLANYDGQISEILNRGSSITQRKKEIEKLVTETTDSSAIESLNTEFKGLEHEWSTLYERFLKLQAERKNIESKIKNGTYESEAASGQKKRDSEDKQNQKRIDAIQDILDNEKKPIELIVNELTKFWEKANKQIAKATEENDQGALERWKSGASSMVSRGLGSIGEDGKYVLPQVEELEALLKSHQSLASSLSEDTLLKTLGPIKELLYFIPEVQKTLGVMPQTEKEYINEQVLQARFREILKINKYIETARGLLSEGDIDINPQSIQEFVDYFGHIPEMATAVELARQYLTKVQAVPEELWKAEDPKTYVDQIQDIWNVMDEGAKKVFLDVVNMTNSVGDKKITSIDSWEQAYKPVLTAYNESNSILRELQTDDPHVQQILAILQRSSLLNSTKAAANQYGERGIISTLFGLQKTQLVGNRDVAKDPIHITTRTQRGKERVFELNAGSGRRAADGYFNYSNGSLSKFFKKTNVESEVGEIVAAMFDPIVVAKDKLESKIKGLSSDIATLENISSSDASDKEANRKKLRSLSYSAFDGTELEEAWHQQKELQKKIADISQVLKSNLSVEQFPDELWQNIKGLRKQKNLEKEITNIKKGVYSQDIEKQLKDLTEKEKKQKVQDILSAKQTELSDLKAANTIKVRAALTEATRKLTALEDQHVNKVQEVLAAKKQELATSEAELSQIKSRANEIERTVQTLLDNLFASGKIKISAGKNANVPEWQQAYQYDKTKLAEYEKKQEQREKLESQISKLESGEYDEVTLKALDGLSDEEQKAKLGEIIASKKQTLARMQQVELTQQEVMQSLLVLEDDISRADAKSIRSHKEAKQHSRKSDRVLDETQYDYANAVKKQKDAITDKDYYLSNLLSNIDFAGANGLMDTSVLSDVAEVYKEALAKAKSMPSRTSVTTDAARAEIDNAWDEFDKARTLLLNTYFGTDGWNLTRVIRDQFSVIDGELARKEQSIQAMASDPQSAVDAQMSEIAAKEAQTKQAADRYAEKLYQKYIVEPQDAINAALRAKESEIQQIQQNAIRQKNELQQRAQSSNVLSGEIARIENERAKDNRLLSIQANKNRLSGVRSALSLLTTGEIADVRKRYDEDKEVVKLKALRDKLLQENKGKTKEYADVQGQLATISAPYIDEINSIIGRYIAQATTAEAKEALEYVRREVGGHKPNPNTMQLTYLQQEEKKLLDKLNGSETTVEEINANYDRRIDAIRTMMESDKEIQQKLSSIDEKYNKDPERLAAEELKATLLGQGKVGTEDFKSVESKLKDINTRYQQEKNVVIQQWVSQQSEEIDRIANQTIEQIRAQAVEDATKDARKEFRTETGSNVRSQSGMERVISEIKETAYREAEAATMEAVAKVDKSKVISPEQVEAELQKAREEADLAKANALLKMRGKTDAELLSDIHTTASANDAAQSQAYADERREKEKQLKEKMALYGITKEMLETERQQTRLEQEYATEVRNVQNAAEETTSAMQSGGMFGGRYGSGYVAIDTSNLAKESTLRGIYELLNGGAPKGGWGVYDDQSTQSNAENELDLTVRSFSAKLSGLASGVGKVVKEIGNLPYENMAILNENGRVGRTISGKENEISGAKISGFLKRHADKNLQMALHNHPDGMMALSPQDIISAIGIGEASSIGAFGSIANGKITGVDFSEVSKELGLAILGAYVKNIQTSKFAELFDDDFNIKPEYANLDGASKQKLSDALNEYLRKAIASVDLDSNEIFGQVDVSELDDASRRVANAVVEAGAQAAVEQSKLITIPNGDISDTTAKDLSKEINNIKGKQDGGSALAGALNNLHYLGFTSGDGYAFKSEDSEKLAKAYSQLQRGMQGTIVEKLDDGVQAYILVLQKQLEAIAEANGLDYAAINKEVESRRASAKNISGTGLTQESFEQVRQYLKSLKETGSNRASEGIKQVYGVLSNGKAELGKEDLKELGSGYYRLVETINHAIFDKLDEQTQQLLIEAKDKALDVLNQYGVKVYGSTDLQGVISEETKNLIAGQRGVKKVGQTLTNMTEPALVQTITKDGQSQDVVLQKAHGQLVAEKAITEEKKKQNQLTDETTKKEGKVADEVKERANAEKKSSDAKKSSKPEISGSSISKSDSSSGGNQGGIIGLLNEIAKEETLKSIASLLSKGIKTTSGGNGGTPGADDDKVSSTEDAATLFDSYIKKTYPNALPYDLTNVEQKGGKYKFTISQYKDLQAIEETKAAIDACEVGTEEWMAKQAQLNTLQREQEKITLSISAKTGEITTSTSLQNIAIGAKAAMKELQNVDELMLRIHESGALSFDGNGEPTSSNQTIDRYLTSLKELRAVYQDGVDSDTLFSPETLQRLSQLTLVTQNYRKEVMALLSASAQYNSGETSLGVLDGIDPNNYSAIKQSMMETVAQNEKFKASFGELTPVVKNGQVVSYQLAYTLRTGKREVQEMTAALNPLTGELTTQKGAVKEVATGWDTFMNELKGKYRAIVQYIASITSIHDFIRYIRNGVQAIREIDASLTELKKVTDETDASYSRFLQNMSKTGAVIGATVTDLTKSAADWARLGYNMQEASELAKNTSILMNVSEFDDVSKATDTVISALQAFKKEGQDVGTFSMEIIDKYNEVGNNYAISTSDLADSLTRSSAALVAANNSLEESIAMTAAANTTIQDPESVGNALKTVSMRIRGVKTELEEAGLETDGMVTNTAKLQEKIMALTNIDGSGGINILTNTGEFKSTYEILLAISKVWQDMDDMSQAALLELVAGELSCQLYMKTYIKAHI